MEELGSLEYNCIVCQNNLAKADGGVPLSSTREERPGAVRSLYGESVQWIRVELGSG